jgi:hypothetical protein
MKKNFVCALAAIALLIAVVPATAPLAAGPPSPPVQSIRVPQPPQHGIPAIVRAAVNGQFSDLEALYPEASPNLRYQAMYEAMQKDRLDVLEWFLKKGMRTNAPEIGLERALFFAAAADKVPAIKLLCQYGANPDWRGSGKHDFVALHAAVRDDEPKSADVKTINAVLDCGVKTLPPREQWQSSGPALTMPVLHDVVRFDDATLVRRVLDLGAKANERSGDRNRTVLFTSGMDMPITELLLSHGADARALDADGTSALAFVACHPGYQANAVIPRLIEAGAPLDTADPSTDWREANGGTALICASKFALVDAVRALLQAGADPNRRDKDGHTAMGIIAAIDSGSSAGRYYLGPVYPNDAWRDLHAQIVELLAQHGAKPDLDPTVRENADGNGPVGRALVAALQSSFGGDVATCMRQRSPVFSPRGADSPSGRAPAGDRYALAKLTALPAAGQVSEWFTLSPNGRWLTYLRGADSRNGHGSRTVVVYDYARDRSQALDLPDEGSSEGVVWRRDGNAVGYILTAADSAVVEMGATAKVSAVDRDHFEAESAPRAGGDPCGARGEKGGLLRDAGRWDPDGQYRLRHPATGAEFKLVAQPPAADVLVLQEAKGPRTLARHDRAWIRNAFRLHAEKQRRDFEEIVESAKPGEREEARKRIAKVTAGIDQQLEQSMQRLEFETSFQLSPSGRYLYYKMYTRSGGWGFGPPSLSRGFVVDLESKALPVWEIAEAVESAQWHPNGRELLLVVLDEPARKDEASRRHLAVARFP